MHRNRDPGLSDLEDSSGDVTKVDKCRSFLQDVRKHFNTESRVWMTYRNGVYDVTDFIAKHPGAQNIMLAAGGDVQPFWDIYSVHKGNEQEWSFCGVVSVHTLSK